MLGVKRKQPLTFTVNGCSPERVTGFEPATSSLGSNDAGDLEAAEVGNPSTDTDLGQADAAAVCTRVCTSEAEAGDAGQLRTLAEAIRGLTAAERETLRELLAESR